MFSKYTYFSTSISIFNVKIAIPSAVGRYKCNWLTVILVCNTVRNYYSKIVGVSPFLDYFPLQFDFFKNKRRISWNILCISHLNIYQNDSLKHIFSAFIYVFPIFSHIYICVSIYVVPWKMLLFYFVCVLVFSNSLISQSKDLAYIVYYSPNSITLDCSAQHKGQ